MRVIVFLKEVPDVKVPYEPSSGGVRDAWNVPMLNPDDMAALRTALRARDLSPEVRVTAVHMGPSTGERFIRQAMALGCDEGLRVWDEDLNIHSRAKALIFARVARILGFDLIITGARSLDTASNQLGVLLAANLEIPCIARAVTLGFGHERVLATSRLVDGYLQEVEAPRPLVVTMEQNGGEVPYADFPRVLEAAERQIPCLDLSDIGLSRSAVMEAEGPLTFGPSVFPVPPLTPTPAPDSALPGYERRERLREGSMAKREGKTLTVDDETLVEEIFRYFLREGWLAHLGPETNI